MSSDYSAFETILDGIEEYRGSDRTAVICGEDRLSYAELLQKAHRLAAALSGKGIRKGDRVLLAMSRSADFLCALLGILYAGAAYVAMDPQWPEERISLIREDSMAAYVLDDRSCQELLNAEASGSLPAVLGSDAIAVYYTSGSTGRPKGTVTHHAVFLHEAMPVPGNICSYETANTCTTVFSMGNFAYGAIACDIFYAFFTGMTLVFATERERLSPSLLGKRMLEHRADALLTTPSLLLRYLEDADFAAGFAALRRVILTGEALSEQDAQRIAGYTDAAIFDAFGASEVRNYAFTRVLPDRPIELGAPTDGARLYVLDEKGRPVEEGQTGELCVGGIPGRYGYYLGLPALTNQKFTVLEGLGRVYHTGDGAILTEDGKIKLTGRLDGMRKLHGQRLEPREIELRMEQVPGIGQAAVDIRGTGADAVLCGWYSAGDPIDETALKHFLAETLPAYMVPARLMRMASLPLNDSGKLDRRALPDIERERTEEADAYVPPRTDAEARLCEAFAKALRRKENVGIHDNFFLLGGDSIRGMLLISDLAERYGMRCTMTELVRSPTPARLVKECGHIPDAKPACETIRWQETLPGELSGIANDPGTEAVFPANNSAVAYLLMKAMGIEDRQNINTLKLTLAESLDEAAFQHRVCLLVRNHPALRSFFVRDKSGKYWQVFSREKPFPTYYRDLRRLSPEASRRIVQGFRQVFDERDDNFQAACFAMPEGGSALLLHAAHTVADGLSLPVIGREMSGDGPFRPDSLLTHRCRVLRSASELPEEIRAYYEMDANKRNMVKDPFFLSQGRKTAEQLCLGREESARLKAWCSDLGITPYIWAQLCYGKAILELLGEDTLWLLTLESGRYPEWEDELRIIGNLTVGTPVRITRELTPERFQEDVRMLRRCPGLADTALFYSARWTGLFEGITSVDFADEDMAGYEIVGLSDRRGASMEMRDGTFLIELRHTDEPRQNAWYARLRKALYERLVREVTQDG